jgi:hypothetical protein
MWSISRHDGLGQALEVFGGYLRAAGFAEAACHWKWLEYA